MSLESAIAKLTASVDALTVVITERVALANQSQVPVTHAPVALSPPPTPPASSPAPVSPSVQPASAVSPMVPAQAPAVTAGPAAPSSNAILDEARALTQKHAGKPANITAVIELLRKHGDTGEKPNVKNLAAGVLPAYVADLKGLMAASAASLA